MAGELNLSYERQSDGLSIIVTDNTGAFNATTNPGGYGGSNPGVGDFSNFYISCYLPDPVTLFPSSTAVVINAYPSLPSASNGTFDLTSLLLTGTSTTVLADGWYQLIASADYDTGVIEGTLTETSNLIMFEVVECCITNMLVKNIGCGCSGTSQKTTNLVKAQLNLEMLQKRAVNDEIVESIVDECSQYNKAVTLLKELQSICDSANCGGCNGCS